MAEVEPPKKLSVVEAQLREKKLKQIQAQQNAKPWPPFVPPNRDMQWPGHMSGNFMFPPGMIPDYQNKEAFRHYLQAFQLQQSQFPELQQPEYFPQIATYLQNSKLNNRCTRQQDMHWSQNSTPRTFPRNMTEQNPFCREAGTENYMPPDANGATLSENVEGPAHKSTIQLQFNLGDLRSALKNLMNRIALKDENEKRAREWRSVLMTIDRLFFWFYLCTIISAGIFLLYPRGRAYSVEEVIAMHQQYYDKRNIAIREQCMMSHSTL